MPLSSDVELDSSEAYLYDVDALDSDVASSSPYEGRSSSARVGPLIDTGYPLIEISYHLFALPKTRARPYHYIPLSIVFLYRIKINQNINAMHRIPLKR